jgi:KDO2-lipid IV(A) lauroyltransferase
MNWQDLSYRIQHNAARALMGFFGLLPLDAASWLGGWLARSLGPLTGAHKTAVSNIARAMPELDEPTRKKIIQGMWDNIGRTTAEYPHLGRLMDDSSRVEVIDPKNLAAKLRDDGIGALLIGMHYGNWELSTLPGHRAGLKQYHFYRAPNNPYVAEMLQNLRGPMQQEGYLQKGSEGARQAVMLLKKHAHIGMLIDQKQDEGIPASFFGRDAMTTTAHAALARRLNVPMIADRVVRTSGAHFKIYVHDVSLTITDDREADIITTTKQINQLLESWIRDRPDLWFWVHRRWPREG